MERPAQGQQVRTDKRQPRLRESPKRVVLEGKPESSFVVTACSVLVWGVYKRQLSLYPGTAVSWAHIYVEESWDSRVNHPRLNSKENLVLKLALKRLPNPSHRRPLSLCFLLSWLPPSSSFLLSLLQASSFLVSFWVVFLLCNSALCKATFD